MKSIQVTVEITNKQVVRVLTKCNGLETTSILPFFNQSHAPNEFLYHGNASKVVVPLVPYCVPIPFSLPYWHGHLPYNKGIGYFFAITSCYRFVRASQEGKGCIKFVYNFALPNDLLVTEKTDCIRRCHVNIFSDHGDCPCFSGCEKSLADCFSSRSNPVSS